MQRAETINCFDVWQHLSAGSRTGRCSSSPPTPRLLWLEKAACQAPGSREAPLQGGPSPDQASGSTSPPSPEANYPPCQPQARPGRPPQTLFPDVSFLSWDPRAFSKLKAVGHLFNAFLSLIRHLSFWSWRKHKLQVLKHQRSPKEDILLPDHCLRFCLLLPHHSHLRQCPQPAYPHLFSDPSPAA